MLWLLLHAYGAHDEELHVLEHGNNPKFPIMHNKENTLKEHFVTMTNKLTIEKVPVYLFFNEHSAKQFKYYAYPMLARKITQGESAIHSV